MYIINGIGDTLYGKRDLWPDGSYIATKWIVLLWIPIFPIGSYRVWRGVTTSERSLFFNQSTDYKMVKVGLNWRQVINVYSIGLFVCLICNLLDRVIGF